MVSKNGFPILVPVPLAKATQESEAFITKLALADSDLAQTQQVITEQHQRMVVDKDQIES